MRFVKEIPNEFCKTTLYNFNNKFIIKLEAGNYEQTFKVSELDLLPGETFENLLNEDFYLKAIERFKSMSNDFNELLV